MESFFLVSYIIFGLLPSWRVALAEDVLILVEEPTFERIVTNYSEISDGVPIDYTFNESSSKPDQLISAPGCPKNVDGNPWLYYGNLTNVKCYLAGKRGPCGKNQVLFVEEGNLYGFCNCVCFEGVRKPEGNKSYHCQENLENYFSFPSKLDFVYEPNVNECYQLYEQGPCNEDEWLVMKALDLDTSPSEIKTKCEMEMRKCPVGEFLDGEGCNNDSCNNTQTAKCRKRTPLLNPLTNLRSVSRSGCLGRYSHTLRKCLPIRVDFVF